MDHSERRKERDKKHEIYKVGCQVQTVFTVHFSRNVPARADFLCKNAAVIQDAITVQVLGHTYRQLLFQTYGKLILMISSLDLLTTGSSCLSTSGATGLLITESQRASELARLQEVRWKTGGLKNAHNYRNYMKP